MSWTGRPGSSTTDRAAGSSAVTNIGATTRYWPGGERAEVDERGLELVRRAKRAIVSLVDRSRAIRVGEQRASCVERVGVRVLEGRGDCQRGRPALNLRSMDAALQRAEAHARAVEDETVAQASERHQVVV